VRKKNQRIVFTTLAINQTTFFEGMGLVLERLGFQVSHVCFHERSFEELKARGRDAYNVHEITPKLPPLTDEPELLIQKVSEEYRIENPHCVLSHEKASFQIKNTDKLIIKFVNYLRAVEQILAKFKDEEVFVVQELGGFTSLFSTYFVSRKLGFEHLFIEPSFFRGRVSFVHNSYFANKVPDSAATSWTEPVKKYIDETIRNKKIVIPTKDKGHYRGVVAKMASKHNVRRLFEKTADKYIFNKKEEFNEILVFVRRHVTMLENKFALKNFYQPLPDTQFIYFPLHVPIDVALTMRSPEYLDQYSLLDYIARNLPVGYKLAVKEHPALVGAIDRTRTSELLSQNDRIMLLDPWINNFDVMNKADLIVTVNSKSGAEAILLEKQVIVLGDSFYRNTKCVHAVDRLADLHKTMIKALSMKANPEAITGFFESVWAHSAPGELYQCDQSNLEIFAESLTKQLVSTRAKSNSGTSQNHEQIL
jgi:hypothetical protein